MFKLFLLTASFFTLHSLNSTFAEAIQNADIITSERVEQHNEYIKEITLAQPCGHYKIDTVTLSILPGVAKAENYISLKFVVHMTQPLEESVHNQTIEKMYQEKNLPELTIISGITPDMLNKKAPWPTSMRMGLKTHFTLTPHKPSKEASFETNVAHFKDILKKYFDLSDGIMDELVSFIETHKKLREASLNAIQEKN